MPEQKIQVAGIPWYSRQAYSRVLEVMEDASQLPDTFDNWLRKAEQTEKELRSRGLRTVRAHIDPDEFVDWCRRLGLNVDSEARNRFANEVAAAEHRGRH